MKELSIEEKAKRYDEAIAHAKMLLKIIGNATLGNLVLKNEFKNMFPELKESEDERIRKKLIEAVKGDMVVGGTKDKQLAISWLEKQGEHANFINKIQIGDKVTRNEDGVLVNLSQLNRVAKKGNMGISEATKKKLEDNLNKTLEKETPESWNEFLDEQGEQNTDEYIEVKGLSEIEAEADELIKEMSGEKHNLTDFERTLADICIGWIGEEPGWVEYIKDNADVLLKIAVKMFNSVQDVPFEQKPAPKHKVGDTIYYNSFGKLKSMIVANVVTDSTDNPMYEHKFSAMTDEEHIAAGHYIDSTGKWIDPNNYISLYYVDW